MSAEKYIMVGIESPSGYSGTKKNTGDLYHIVDMKGNSRYLLSGVDIAQKIALGIIEVSNMEIEGNTAVPANARVKYSITCCGNLIKIPTDTVLCRVDKSDGTLAYRVITAGGKVLLLSLELALKSHNVSPFSNAKIRNIGDKCILQSIKGDFYREVEGRKVDKVDKKESYSINIMQICENKISVGGNQSIKYALIEVTGSGKEVKQAIEKAKEFRKMAIEKIGKWESTENQVQYKRFKGQIVNGRRSRDTMYLTVDLSTALKLKNNAVGVGYTTLEGNPGVLIAYFECERGDRVESIVAVDGGKLALVKKRENYKRVMEFYREIVGMKLITNG